MDPKTLGTRIKAVRNAWGWSQQKVAAALHVDQASVSFWERDRIMPSGAALVALSALLGCTAEALEHGVGWEIPEGPAMIPVFSHLHTRSIQQSS